MAHFRRFPPCHQAYTAHPRPTAHQSGYLNPLQYFTERTQQLQPAKLALSAILQDGCVRLYLSPNCRNIREPQIHTARLADAIDCLSDELRGINSQLQDSISGICEWLRFQASFCRLVVKTRGDHTVFLRGVSGSMECQFRDIDTINTALRRSAREIASRFAIIGTRAAREEGVRLTARDRVLTVAEASRGRDTQNIYNRLYRLLQHLQMFSQYADNGLKYPRDLVEMMSTWWARSPGSLPVFPDRRREGDGEEFARMMEQRYLRLFGPLERLDLGY